MSAQENGHREAITRIALPSNGADEQLLGSLGVSLTFMERTSLLLADLPKGFLRVTGPEGQWLIPTTVIAPDGTRITAHYEDGQTVITPPAN